MGIGGFVLESADDALVDAAGFSDLFDGDSACCSGTFERGNHLTYPDLLMDRFQVFRGARVVSASGGYLPQLLAGHSGLWRCPGFRVRDVGRHVWLVVVHVYLSPMKAVRLQLVLQSTATRLGYVALRLRASALSAQVE